MPTGLIVSKLVTTVILLLSNVITMFLPNFVQLDEARFYKDMDSLTIFENTLDEPIPQTEIFQLVEAHFRAPLADGKTVKKALIMAGTVPGAMDLRILIPKTNEAACISCSTTAVKLHRLLRRRALSSGQHTGNEHSAWLGIDFNRRVGRCARHY